MAKKEDTIEVEVEDAVDAYEKDEINVVVAEEAEEGPPRGIDPEEGLDALKAQLESERQARYDAERRAQQAAQQAYQAQNEKQDSDLHLVSNAIDTVRQKAEILKAAYRDAMSMSDFDRAADLQQEMSDNSARLLQLEHGRQALEQQPKRQPPPPPRPTDPVEAIASQLSPRSASWVRAHPQFARDERLFNKMVAAHNLATADGIEPDTDDYFESIENLLGVRQSQVSRAEEPTSVAAKVTQRRYSPPEAPVSRSGNGTGSRSNVVQLTKEQKEAAEMNGMTYQEYARNVLTLRKEGKIN